MGTWNTCAGGGDGRAEIEWEKTKAVTGFRAVRTGSWVYIKKAKTGLIRGRFRDEGGGCCYMRKHRQKGKCRGGHVNQGIS